MSKILVVLTYIVFANFCLHVIAGKTCDSCDESSCDPPHGCLAGMVKDDCDCCYVCGRREGERCDNEEVNYVGFGKCGDNLECRARNDLDWGDPPEAVCFCLSQSPLCGSDGVTYENKCQLTEARYRRRDGLRAVSSDPCIKSPRITTPPQNVRNSTGTSASMACEASAWPVPTIQWFMERNEELQPLPGNNTRVAVQSRSGPGVDEATSWLLFVALSEEDEGSYVCKAENDVGSDSAIATVTIPP